MTLKILARHPRVGIDSNVLIYLFEGTGPLAEKAGELLDAIADGQAEGVISTLVVAEICSGPAIAGESALVERYSDELNSLDNVRVVSVTPDLAVDAAILRGSGAASLSDAIHLASACSAGATGFVTNDRRIKSTSRLEVVYLTAIQ